MSSAAVAAMGAVAIVAIAFARQPDTAGRKYWEVPLDSAAVGHFHKHTHVAVTGTVAYVVAEADGDTHIKLVSDKGAFIVAECTPKEPCTHPAKGSKITVRGISRQDQEHGWWEVHPIESWSVAQ